MEYEGLSECWVVVRWWQSFVYSLPHPVKRLGHQMKLVGVSLKRNKQEMVVLLTGSRQGNFLVKHLVDAESSLDKLLEIKTFWRLVYKQISRAEKCPELKVVGRMLWGSTYNLALFTSLGVSGYCYVLGGPLVWSTTFFFLLKSVCDFLVVIQVCLSNEANFYRISVTCSCWIPTLIIYLALLLSSQSASFKLLCVASFQFLRQNSCFWFIQKHFNDRF